VKDYASYSYWLETAGDLTPRPPLDGSIDCDVAILGAGYTGLWTAYYLLRARPGLRVVLLEKEIAGFGASGRNGGWCSSKLNIGLDVLAERHGPEAARAVQRAMYESVDEIGRVCAAERIDADTTKLRRRHRYHPGRRPAVRRARARAARQSGRHTIANHSRH